MDPQQKAASEERGEKGGKKESTVNGRRACECGGVDPRCKRVTAAAAAGEGKETTALVVAAGEEGDLPNVHETTKREWPQKPDLVGAGVVGVVVVWKSKSVWTYVWACVCMYMRIARGKGRRRKVHHDSL